MGRRTVEWELAGDRTHGIEQEKRTGARVSTHYMALIRYVPSIVKLEMATDSTTRCHDFSASRDHLSLSSTQPVTIDSRRIKPCVQRSCAASVRSFAQRDPWAFSQWYAYAVYTGLSAG